LLRWALAWLAHPVSLVAIAVLVVNDHLLKAQFGTWWTGKLSDVAGMVFFPALVAVVMAAVAPRLTQRQVVALAVTVTALGFAWVKTADAGAATASAVLTGLAGPSAVLKDATDLLALPALMLAAYVGWRVTGDARAAMRRAGVTVALPVAVLATVATGAAGPPEVDRVTAIDDSAYVEVTQAGEFSTWYRLSDAPSLEPIPVGSDVPRQLRVLGPHPVPVCLATAPTTCFRPTPGRWGVDISTDGGATWTPELAVTDRQAQRIARDHIWAQNPTPQTTRAVVVGKWRGEEAVIAANGADGFAIRTDNGSWSRYNFPHEWGTFDKVPLPSPYVAEPAVAMQYLFFVGAACTCLAIVITGAARRWRARRWQRWAAGPGLTVFAALTAWALWALVKLGDVHPSAFVWLEQAFAVVGLLALLGVFTVAMPLLLGWHARDSARHVVGWPALIGFGSLLLVVVVDILLDLAGADWLAQTVWNVRVPTGTVLTLAASAVVVARRWQGPFERPATEADDV
jgi:hypothetical protein